MLIVVLGYVEWFGRLGLEVEWVKSRMNGWMDGLV